MIEVRQTPHFLEWLAGLKDRRARALVTTRIARVQAGLFGDAKYFDGIGELRIDYGPGYRVYFTKRGSMIVVLLCGGDKSTQAKDIKRAIDMAQNLGDEA
jgi:putative addiction module killer protein